MQSKRVSFVNVSSHRIAACVLAVAAVCSHAQVIRAPTAPFSGSGSGLSMQFYCDEFEAQQNVRQVALAAQVKVKNQERAASAAQPDARPGAGVQAVNINAHSPSTANAQPAISDSVASSPTAKDAEGPDPEVMASACRMMRVLKADDKSHYIHGYLHKSVRPR